MRRNLHRVRTSLAEGFNVAASQWYWNPAETHETYDSGYLLHSQPILNIDSNEDITRKQRKLQFFLPILPFPNRSIYRQKRLDPAFVELLGHSLLVLSKCVCCIPLRLSPVANCSRNQISCSVR